MADRRPGGIEKIAHLFIAGGGAGSLRARDNGHLRWTSPTTPPGNGQGAGAGGVREGLPNGQTAADKSFEDAGQQVEQGPGTSVHDDRNPPAADHSAQDLPVTDGASCAEGTDGSREADRVQEQQAEAGGAAGATGGAASGPSKALEALQSLLRSAKVAAVLSGHMGPLAGPAAELFAKTLAREGSRVAMLYGPADLACLHRFTATPGDDDSSDTVQTSQDAPADTNPCDVLLLPDWVFQFDLWPISRGVHSICLGSTRAAAGSTCSTAPPR